MKRISDLKDPNDPEGRTFGEVNAAKTHAIPVGALVELPDGVRLFVVHHARDCDQTLLYCLSFAKPESEELATPRFFPRTWVTGVPEIALTVVKT